jgi:hypothetical protein
MANDTYDDSDMWQSASDARLDRPKDPMMDDVETVQRGDHRAMAELALAHQEAKEEVMNNRNISCMVMIGGKACDPELELRLSELEGQKEQAYTQIKKLCAVKLAGVLAHHLGKSFHVSTLSHT